LKYNDHASVKARHQTAAQYGWLFQPLRLTTLPRSSPLPFERINSQKELSWLIKTASTSPYSSTSTTSK
jgi:hypothetical protein